MVYIQVGSGGGVNYQPLCAMGILPILICIFIKYRQEELFRLRSRQFLTENDSTNFVIRAVLNYQLIADYDVRTALLADYEDVFKKFRRATVMIQSSSTNSKMFASWLTTALVGGWIIIGGQQVIQNPETIAQFLTTISLFQAVGAEIEVGYLQSLSVTNAYASIAAVTQFLNMPIDGTLKKKKKKKKEEEEEEEEEEHLKKLTMFAYSL